MDTTRPLAVKQFVATVRDHCKLLSRDELINTIIGLGLEAKPQQRQDYLRRIAVLAKVVPREEDTEATAAQCAKLVQQIHERWTRVNDGTWWDEPDIEVGYENDDELPSMLTPDQEEDLLALFAEADALFFEERYTDAERLYSALLPLFLPDEYDSSVTNMASEFSLREVRARHARCVYEIASPRSRVRRVLRALNSEMRWQGSWADPDQQFPTLSDVANAAPVEPADFGSFVLNVKRTLRDAARDGYRDEALFLEAIRATEGVEGLHAVVRDWGGAHPRGYYEWMAALRGHENWKELIAAAREALVAVQAGAPNHRMTTWYAASALAEAGEVLNDPVVAIEGRRRSFTLRPSDTSLVDLLRYAQRIEKLQEELAAAVAFLKTRDKALYVKSLLIAGRLGETFPLLQNCKPLGWSYGRDPAALCFSAILAYRVLPRLSGFPTIDRFFRSNLSPSSTYTYWPGTDSDNPQLPQDRSLSSELYDEVIAGLSQTGLETSLEEKYLAWAESIGAQRIDSIVSNLHRGAYRRAAIVLVALAERLLADGRKQDATQLIALYQGKYNRHRAFKAELATVVSQSALAAAAGESGRR